VGYLSPPPSPAPVVVYKDVGGLVSDYEAQTEQYRRENREVKLHECRSACTLALSLPNVCVYPDAKVKFHQAYNALNREADLGVSAQLFASYPAAVQARLGTLTREYRVLSGTELIALGMRNCNRDDDRTLIARRQTNSRVAAKEATPASPLGDLAKSVQTAVASALQTPEPGKGPPISLAVADRRSLPSALPRITGDASARFDVARNDVAASNIPLPPTRFDAGPSALHSDVRFAEDEDIPTPPRRPPSEAFTRHEELPPLAREQYIGGAQPILATTQFAPGTASAR
jgi:hypothetical protein